MRRCRFCHLQHPFEHLFRVFRNFGCQLSYFVLRLGYGWREIGQEEVRPYRETGPSLGLGKVEVKSRDWQGWNGLGERVEKGLDRVKDCPKLVHLQRSNGANSAGLVVTQK
jgi:hypothetical protein